MKTLLKIVAAVALLGSIPAAAHGQAAAPAASAPAPALKAAPAPAPERAAPAPAPSAGAQPAQISGPDAASGRPSDSQVARTTRASDATPQPGIGQPDGRMSLQDQVSPIGQEAVWFHDVILLPTITIISLFVLALLLWVIVRYRRSAHPVPSRTTHNTALEIVWTLVPVLILVMIAVPSIRLLANQYSPPRADLTVKVIGNQWWWDYEYPDHGIQLTSQALSDEESERRGEPRILAVDERVVVPVNATVKLIVTSADVVHSFGVPAFWVKIDAVPGRLNETWFRADRPGLYYGQCYELCGSRHAYMPVAIEVVTQEQFAAWVASRGGTMPGARPAGAPVSPDATNRPVPAPAGVGPGDATETSPAPAVVSPGTATPPVSSQGTANSRRGGSQ